MAEDKRLRRKGRRRQAGVVRVAGGVEPAEARQINGLRGIAFRILRYGAFPAGVRTVVDRAQKIDAGREIGAFPPCNTGDIPYDESISKGETT